MDSRRPPTLLGLSSYLAGHVSRIGHRGLVEALSSHGLRLPHFAVLSALNDFGPLAQHDLSDHLGLNRSHLVGYLDDLEQAGFVSRTRDPADRRRQLVVLQPSGIDLFARLAGLAEESEAAELSMLTASDRRTLARLLKTIVIAHDRAYDQRAIEE